MPETNDVKVTPEVEKAIGDATSTDQIAQIISEAAADQGIELPRNERGQFRSNKQTATTAKVETKETEDAPGFTDKFVIGGKEVEISGSDAADVLRQYKAAVGAYNLGRDEAKPKTEEKKAETKPTGPTKEELLLISARIQAGDTAAIEEYVLKTGLIDRYLDSKGVKVDDLKAVSEERVEDQTSKNWQDATQEFISEVGDDWPGGQVNMKLMGNKLQVLGLTGVPTKDSLLTAFNSLKEDGIDFSVIAAADPTTPQNQSTDGKQAPEKKAAQEAPPVVKKKATGSTVFGVSGGSSTKAPVKKGDASVPSEAELAKMDPREIMNRFRESVIANGGDPNEELVKAYSGRR